jgi:hypothetical protein
MKKPGWRVPHPLAQLRQVIEQALGSGHRNEGPGPPECAAPRWPGRHRLPTLVAAMLRIRTFPFGRIDPKCRDQVFTARAPIGARGGTADLSHCRGGRRDPGQLVLCPLSKRTQLATSRLR